MRSEPAISTMTNILVNALSVTNQSGLHVLAGHLDQLVGKFPITVLARPSMTRLKERFEERVEWIYAPENTARWLPRAIWEFQSLGKIARTVAANYYFTPSGIAASRLSVPQVVLCQNPWALVSSARRAADAPKAWLQRRAYRKTMRRAEVMVFNSEYMQKAYRENAGFNEKRGVVVYQAADEETQERSKHWKKAQRNPGQIVCVSAMAPHKNIETLLRAFEMLKTEERNSERGTCKTLKQQPSGFQTGLSNFHPFSLHLVGAWPDPVYEQKILRLVADLGLSEQVQIHDFVSREELDRIYAESQVFCLMSRCESFGIPAIEAQLFGTPVVCSNVCAIPEICGEGGLFCDPDDINGIASALDSLLTNSNHWKTFSEKARINSDRFVWESCSQPLLKLFEKEEG